MREWFRVWNRYGLSGFYNVLWNTELYGVTMLDLIENIGVIPIIKILDGASRSSSSVIIFYYSASVSILVVL